MQTGGLPGAPQAEEALRPGDSPRDPGGENMKDDWVCCSKMFGLGGYPVFSRVLFKCFVHFKIRNNSCFSLKYRVSSEKVCSV